MATAKKKAATKKKADPVDIKQFEGQFVEITKGDDKGKFGAIIEVTPDGKGILRTRDNNTERIVVDAADLEFKDQAGRR